MWETVSTNDLLLMVPSHFSHEIRLIGVMAPITCEEFSDNLSQKQVCARNAPGLALLLARERWLKSAPPPAHERHSEPTSTNEVEQA